MAYGGVKVVTGVPTLWRKVISGVTNSVEGMNSARDIGYLRLNYSRVNLIGSLTPTDKENWYKIQINSPGDFRLTIKHAGTEDEINDYVDSETDPDKTETEEALDEWEEVINSFKASGLRVELMMYNPKGGKTTVIGSNDASNDQAYANFEQMIRGTYKIDRQSMGTMYLHVSRIDGKKLDSTENYVMQMQVGDSYKHDYVTIERAPQDGVDDSATVGYVSDVDKLLANARVSSNMLAAQSAASILTMGASNFMATTGRANTSLYGPSIFDFLI
jgi:hypothetical protein